MKFVALVGIWLALVPIAGACPMCASGGPADYVRFDDSEEIRFTPVKLNKWSASLDAKTISSSEDENGADSHRQSQVGFSLAYRPTIKLFLLARVPFSSTTLEESGEGKHTNSGLGDSELLLGYEFKRASARMWPAVSAVVKIPTGDNDVQEDAEPEAESSLDHGDGIGTRLNEHGQIGTGAVDAMLMGHLRWAGTYRMSATLGARYNGENSFHYQYGAVIWLDYNINRTICRDFWGGASARLRGSERDSNGNNEIYNSGGTLLLLMPELGYSFGRSLSLFAQCSFPLANELNGTQSEKLGFSVSLSQSF